MVASTVKTFKYVEKDGVNKAAGLFLYEGVFSEEELQEMEQKTIMLERAGLEGTLTGESVVKTARRSMILCGYHYQYYETPERRKGVWNEVPVEPIQPWMVSSPLPPNKPSNIDSDSMSIENRLSAIGGCWSAHPIRIP